VSLEVSPLLAHDTASTIAAAKKLSARAGRSNLFIKIPGTKEGLPAIEEASFAGVPVNVTLLFSREQYVAAAEAYLRGIERRIAAGLNPQVGSVASMFISRWDVAVAGRVPHDLQAGAQPAHQVFRSMDRSAEGDGPDLGWRTALPGLRGPLCAPQRALRRAGRHRGFPAMDLPLKLCLPVRRLLLRGADGGPREASGQFEKAG
jgi:hypothetical protein